MTNPTWHGAPGATPQALCTVASIQPEPTHPAALQAVADRYWSMRRRTRGFADEHTASTPASHDREVMPS